jgi:hypothetical protein
MKMEPHHASGLVFGQQIMRGQFVQLCGRKCAMPNVDFITAQDVRLAGQNNG